MILRVFSVYDKAVGAYLPPFYCRSAGEAVRSFTDLCADNKSNFFKFAPDYLLVDLGSFDDATGLFASKEPDRVIAALEVISDPQSLDRRPM